MKPGYKKTVYPEERKAAALAALVANDGNMKVTAQQLGIPRPTLIQWRDKSRSPIVSNTIPLDTRQARIDLWDQTQQLGAQRIMQLLPLSTDLREVAYASQVAVNAYQDLAYGRRNDSNATPPGLLSLTVVDNSVTKVISETIRERLGSLIQIARVLLLDDANDESAIAPPSPLVIPANVPPPPTP
mgnify:CR=1 FL=1